MKKQVLAMLKASGYNAKNSIENTRIYSEGSRIWLAHSNFYVDARIAVGYADSDIDIMTDTSEVIALVNLEKTLSVQIEYGEVKINGVACRKMPPNTQLSYYAITAEDPAACVSWLSDSNIAKVQKAAKFCGKDDNRPLFQNVYIDETDICATNTHYLYTAPHAMPDVKKPIFIPSSIVSVLRCGELTIFEKFLKNSKEKTVDCYLYAVKSDGFELRWRSPAAQFPDFRRVVEPVKQQEEIGYFTASKDLIGKVKREMALWKIQSTDKKDKITQVKLSEVFGTGTGYFNGTFLALALETIAGNGFVLTHKNHLAPISITTTDETIILTPLLVKNSEYAEAVA